MELSAETIVYQAALFVALYFVLKNLVFDRFLANLDARHDRTRGALEAATRLREEAARLQADYESQMAQLRRRAAAEREEIRKQAEEQERELVESARREAASALAEARAKLAADAEATRATLAGEVTRLSEEILTNLLGRRP
jgi:F-type H+-transporting ATPase subunit b